VTSYRDRVPKGCTFVHLVGVRRPSPAKAAKFRAIVLASIGAAVEAARFAQVRRLLYVSVAHPAPVMQACIAMRAEGEALIRSASLNAWGRDTFWGLVIGGRECGLCITPWSGFRKHASPWSGWA
jgi:hypothetical protein